MTVTRALPAPRPLMVRRAVSPVLYFALSRAMSSASGLSALSAAHQPLENCTVVTGPLRPSADTSIL